MSATPLQKLTRTTLEEKGWSIRRASLKAGLSHSTLHKLLHSKNPRPTAKTVLSLAELFGWNKIQALQLAGLRIDQLRSDDQEENGGRDQPVAQGIDANLDVISKLEEINLTVRLLEEKLDILIVLLAGLSAPVEAPKEPEPNVMPSSKGTKSLLDEASAQVADILNQKHVNFIVESIRQTLYKRGREEKPNLIPPTDQK
jgi:transcriptional regulator with XRE-family HTH domain